MAKFEVKVCKITVEDHPNADVLEVGRIDGYTSIIPKGVYSTGDLVVYIPEQAIVPDDMLDELKLKGKLAGKLGNRVKAMKLRGILSQGLIYPNKGNWNEGEILNDELGIIKYIPEIPEEMEGKVVYIDENYTIKYDIENIKNFPNYFKEGELVQITEKLHGTFTIISAIPSTWSAGEGNSLIDDRYAVASKGLGDRSLVFEDCEENKDNLYLKTARNLDLFKKAGEIADKYNTIVILTGEIFGQGVQDLQYGFVSPEFRLFDVAVGEDRHNKRFLNNDEIEDICNEFDILRVPLLYVGKFTMEILNKYTNGKETVSGEKKHIREGAVIKPLVERYEDGLGRLMLKSISEDYLLRKNGTEYN